MSITYLTGSDRPAAPPQNVLIVAHHESVFAADTISELVASLIPGDRSLIAAAGRQLSPSREAGACIDFLVPGAEVQHVGVAVIPRGCSRHNAPGRPHAITELVKSFRASGSLAVVLIPESVEHAFAGYCAVSRAFPLYSRKSTPPKPIDVAVYVDLPAEQLGNIPSHAAHVGLGIQHAARLVDMPTNELHTDAYVEEARAVAHRIGCGFQAFRGEELREMGLGGLYGVGAAAEHPSSLVILSHVPADVPAGTKSICLVGKGIVYDTGGLSIKDKSSMPGMKRDMGGSAGVLAAFEALVKANVNKPVHALLCLAENSVASNATRPDDIHTFFSGKTVEINNTDAEGRLVLADGAAYATAHLNPGFIIDMATLTGAQGIATGKKHAAIYCNDEALESLCMRIGRYTGDLVFPVPYCPEFFRPEFRSAVADMKNSVADRTNAQCSCAAQFIGNHIEPFLENDGKWLHIDMAYPVHNGERATGYGVALLFSLVQNL